MLTLSTIASVLACLWVAYALFGGGIQSEVEKAVTAVEMEKVWGEENYALVQKIFWSDKFKETQKQQLEMAIGQIDSTASAPDQAEPSKETEPSKEADTVAPNADTTASNTLTDEVLASLKKDTYVKWKEDALITVMEFSDLECPFCAKLHANGTPKALADKYGDKINFVFKHFPLSFHKYAQQASEALECAWELGGSDKFYAFIEAVFKAGQPTESVIAATVKDLWLDATTFDQCLKSAKFASKIKTDMTQWSSIFGVQGTPNSIIINNQTKKYLKVEGAYPTDQFVSKIEELMK